MKSVNISKAVKAATPMGVGIGVMVALLLSLGGCAVVAYLISNGYISQSAMKIYAAIILMLSAFIGALIAYGRVKKQRLQISVITAAVYYLCLLAITALFFGGQFAGAGTGAIVVILGCCAAALLGISPGKKRKFQFRKRGYR